MAELDIIEKVIALEGVELLKNLNPDQLSESRASPVRHGSTGVRISSIPRSRSKRYS